MAAENKKIYAWIYFIQLLKRKLNHFWSLYFSQGKIFPLKSTRRYVWVALYIVSYETIPAGVAS